MREILFRGQMMASGAWIYGDLRQYPKGATAIKQNDFPSIMEVRPETVGQYTGLTDKNGTKIFEGDILSARFDENYPENESRAIVEWCNFGWNTHQPGYDPDAITGFDENLWLVIGNIHDNPELLEGN